MAALGCMAETDLHNRGTFMEFRNGMVNITPIGRNATSVQPLTTPFGS
jgi:hypothetical protein